MSNMKHIKVPLRLLALTLLGVLVACGGSKRKIRYSDSIVDKPKTPSQRSSSEPYVVKMSDGKRTWQIELPVGRGTPSFQAAIPLDLGDLEQAPPSTPPSEADREIIDAKRSRGEAVPQTEPGQPEVRTSYLATLARVRALYQRRQYELALVDLVNLDRQFPDDERILEMKGTLYKKLGRRQEAKEAWERVLSLNPDNTMVARALEQLEVESP